MTEDTFPPPDDEELEAANALRQALEGRPGGPRVPEEALATAAFLRHAGQGGGLSSERNAQLRSELLASLPAAPAAPPRQGWRQLFNKQWLGIGITLIGAASAAVTVGVLGVREWSTHDPEGEARSRVLETAARSDESSASAPVAGDTEDLASIPPPSELAAPAQVMEGESAVAQRAIGGLAQPELASPLANAERRRSVARKTASPALGAASGGAPPSKLEPRSAASANEVAPSDDDGRLARGSASASKKRAEESKGGGGAVLSVPAAAAPGATGAVQATDARITRQRLDRRSRLLAQLGDTSVQSAYAEADRAHSATELEQARERLTALSSAGLGGTSTAVEAEQLRPDVYCRLAEITLRLGQARAALDWARQGLELGSEPSPFVACLYQQQGRAREALGDRDGAARSYMNALQVNERLLDESLEGP
ncbi:MAG: hypothetical protein RL685_3918 [Pseudomonadota bacterium]|jgi:predicted negative regulator of RcsB-dependent stress response